jgi:hypothetical protein
MAGAAHRHYGRCSVPEVWQVQSTGIMEGQSTGIMAGEEHRK